MIKYSHQLNEINSHKLLSLEENIFQGMKSKIRFKNSTIFYLSSISSSYHNIIKWYLMYQLYILKYSNAIRSRYLQTVHCCRAPLNNNNNSSHEIFKSSIDIQSNPCPFSYSSKITNLNWLQNAVKRIITP